MTGIVHHTSKRIGWHQTRHTFLADVGAAIEIQQLEVSDLFEDRLIDPPYRQTRFFEIELDEIQRSGVRSSSFRNIFPVMAHREPDWHFLRFHIRQGSWTITERMQSVTSSGETQWIYTDDFNLIFLASGGRYDAATLIQIITGKLDAIAESIRNGSRIPSEFESQQSCRTVLDTMFSEGIEGAFRDTILYQHHTRDFPGAGARDPGLPATATIGVHHGKAAIPSGQASGVHVDLDQIEDLRDLNWLDD